MPSLLVFRSCKERFDIPDTMLAASSSSLSITLIADPHPLLFKSVDT
jgi:hypothetical protein